MEDNSLWKKIIISKYEAEGGRWLPMQGENGSESNMWSDILSVAKSIPGLLEFFLSKFQIKVGNGNRVAFWHDRWMLNVHLKKEFPRLFMLSMEKEGTLSSFMQRRDNAGVWKLLFRRPLLAWEEGEVIRLHEVIRNVPCINLELQDSVSWAASSSGVFTVASLRNWHETTQSSLLQVPRLLWNNVAPPKAQFLSWLAWRGRVKTTDMMVKFGVLSPTMVNECPFCKNEAETVDHLFVLCPEGWKVWSKLLLWWRLN